MSADRRALWSAHAASGRALSARAVASSAYARNFSPTMDIDVKYADAFISLGGSRLLEGGNEALALKTYF
jgi:hypothetical protein